ncbi:hypothetical protein [Hahella ganghwensis]|uniref:hypothetical protein n=1 Tax=Hahella ganghwensis TaxID=286420 RepID=UPI0003714469|nr:hypothetical protein [Hahella ganghwensis]
MNEVRTFEKLAKSSEVFRAGKGAKKNESIEMHINCECSEKIYDISDGHQDKDRWLPDKRWDDFIGALENLSKMKDNTDTERDRALHDHT